MMGNEVALLYAVMFGTLWAHLRGKPVYVGIGIGYLARGEFVLIFLPILVHAFRVAKKEKGSYKHVFPYLSKISIIALLIALSWHLYYFYTFDSFIPNTLKVKIIQGESGNWFLYHQHLWPYIKELLGNRSFLLIFVAIGLVWQPYLSWFMVTFTLLHFLAYSFLKVPHYHWYYYDFYVVILILMFFGIFWLLDALTRVFLLFLRQLGGRQKSSDAPSCKSSQGKKYLTHTVFILFIIYFFPIYFEEFSFNKGFYPYPDQREKRLFSQRERYHSYATLSRRLMNDLRVDDIILASEVGIISYLLKGHEIRDVNGLASPHVTLKNINNYSYFINYYKPRFLILVQRNSREIIMFQYDEDIYIYRQYFITNAKAKLFPASVYELLPRSSEAKWFQAIIRTGKYSSDVRYIVENRGPALFCHAPFESTIQLPSDSSRFEMQVGFAAGLLEYFQEASAESNGVKVAIRGIHADKEVEEL